MTEQLFDLCGLSQVFLKDEDLKSERRDKRFAEKLSNSIHIGGSLFKKSSFTDLRELEDRRWQCVKHVERCQQRFGKAFAGVKAARGAHACRRVRTSSFLGSPIEGWKDSWCLFLADDKGYISENSCDPPVTPKNLVLGNEYELAQERLRRAHGFLGVFTSCLIKAMQDLLELQGHTKNVSEGITNCFLNGRSYLF